MPKASPKAGPVDAVADTEPKPDVRKSPTEWALKLNVPLWKFNAARHLHRWDLHVEHMNGPIQLTQPDFEAACEAACKHGKGGKYVPHKAALFSLSRS